MLTKAEITEFLKTNGIENGADGLIDAMISYLDRGLLLIPTHTWDEVGRDNPFYDVRNSVPCIGTLSVVAFKRTDGIRSLHPTHSVVAFGPDAAEYIKGEKPDTLVSLESSVAVMELMDEIRRQIGVVFPCD